MVLVHMKNSGSDPANYRPMSLLSVVGKVFERIMVEAISCHFNNNTLLSGQQFGFRHG